MKGIFKLILLATLLCLSSFSYAEVTDESLNKLLDLSGLTKQIGQFPETIKGSMQQARQQGTPIPDEDHKAMMMAIDQSMVPSEMVADIRTLLKKSISEDEAKQLLVWYESDLGREITSAEVKASTAEAYKEMMQTAETLMQDLERLEYAMRLDMLLGLTKMTMDLTKQTGIATYSAIMTAMQPDAPLDLEPLKAKMKAERAQTREAIKGMVLLSLVYTYKDLEIEKLRQYETFLKDPSTMKFNKTGIKGLYRALSTSISKFTRALVVMLEGKKQEK